VCVRETWLTPIGFDLYPRQILPENHWQVLAAAVGILLDWAMNGLEGLVEGVTPADLEIAAVLPPGFRARANEGFLRKFPVCLSCVGVKLHPPMPQPLSCTAEEIVLVAAIELATYLIEQQNGAPNFGTWFAAACVHPEVQSLFDTDGGHGSALAASPRWPALQFDHWFAPFDTDSLIHPYFELSAISAHPGGCTFKGDVVTRVHGAEVTELRV
jgi:hypothetical protein